MYAEMSVYDACKSYSDFRQFLFSNPDMMKEMLTDKNYIVRVDTSEDGTIIEVGYIEDEWAIEQE